MENRTLHFSIEGSFITKIAKEWYFLEHKPYETVEELLLSCMEGSEETKEQLKIRVQDILMGRAEFRGNSGDGTFRLVYPDENLNTNNIFTEYSKMGQMYKEAKKETDRINDRYSRLIECLEEWSDSDELDTDRIEDLYVRELLERIERHYDPSIYLAKKKTKSYNTGSSLLDSFMKATANDVKYGWLDPTGKFYEVEFGDHTCWPYACIWSKEGYFLSSHRSEVTDLSHYKEEYKKWCDKEKFRDKVSSGADFLVEKGWVLIHNPGQGIPVITKTEIQRLTKAQKEFLFDYYTNINEPKKASELYADEEF